MRAFLLLLAGAALAALPAEDSGRILHVERSSPGDLEVGGELAGLPPGSTRYIRYEDLLRMPEETYTVSDDSNLSEKAQIGGVALGTLVRFFGRKLDDPLIVAICYEIGRAHV